MDEPNSFYENASNSTIGYFCSAYDTGAKFYTLIITSLLVIFIYSLCFVIGVRNIWFVLYRQRYYKSVFLTTQYIFGQIICLVRAASTILIVMTVLSLKHEGFCEFGIIQDLEHFPQLRYSLGLAGSSLCLIFIAMASKSALGLATLAMVTSLFIKIKIIYKKEGAQGW